MYNPDTEVLFPLRVVPLLRPLHGPAWHNLIDRIQSEEALPAERFAFALMMVRMCGCVGCNADSFRAMRGCSQCARQTARRFRGTDQEFVEQFKQVQKEVEAYIAKLNSAEDPGETG
jgi:hypothetical protein